jgi:hypothetical protein
MKTERPSKKLRFRAGRTMAWPEVLHDFDCFSSVNPEYEPMRQLVYDLHTCAISDLHATQTMGGNLLLSPDEELHRDDNVLLIEYYPAKQRFHFEHRTISKKNDSQEVDASEAWHTLRLFLSYKFGFQLPKDRPNKPLDPPGT